MANLKRPGGELASRPLHFFWVVDCSGSMYGEKIGTVNHAIQSTIPEMADAARDNPNAQLLIRTLKFSTGASWVTTNPVPVEEFAWDDLDSGGVTDLGKAFEIQCFPAFLYLICIELRASRQSTHRNEHDVFHRSRLSGKW